MSATRLYSDSAPSWTKKTSPPISRTVPASTADRVAASGRYAYAFHNPWIPKFGPLIGYEFLRFELDGSDDALSVRYSVLRGGLHAAWEVPFRSKFAQLSMGPEFALRFPLGDADPKLPLGYDVGAQIEARFFERFVARVRLRYMSQTSSVLGDDIQDQHIDTGIELGFSI